MKKRRLLLMRHAKSDWADETLSDHDRPLNARGSRDAPRMAEWIRQFGELPDRILCSSAVRTCETSRLMNESWGGERDILASRSLYLAHPRDILIHIQDFGGDAETLLVIGHNPGMTHLASVLADQSIEMPTAAIAAFECDVVDWALVHSPDDATLIESVRPKGIA